MALVDDFARIIGPTEGLAAVIKRLGMTNKDAAAFARSAYGVGQDVDQTALDVLNKFNSEVLGLRSVPGYILTKPPTAAASLKSGLAKQVADMTRKNTLAFDTAIPDSILGNFDWYGLASMDASNVGRSLGFKIPGRQRDVGAGIIATLSPKTKWEVNKKRAMLAAKAYKTGELDRFLTFVDNNNLWGKSLNDIRKAASDAGEAPFKYISGINTYQARDINNMISSRTGLATLKTEELAKKIDDFYGAIRLPDADRNVLIRAGVMDPVTNKILDPSYIYMGQELGTVPTGPVVDKISAGIGLGVPQFGYEGFDLPLLDDPRTYRMQSDAIIDAASISGKTPLRQQSDPWAKRHILYPEVTIEEVLSAGGVRTPEELTQNIQSINAELLARQRIAEGLDVDTSIAGSPLARRAAYDRIARGELYG